MLVLTRKTNEIIELAGGSLHGGATIVVVSVRGDKVRLGIQAPPSVSVHRREISEAIARSGGDPQRRPVVAEPDLSPCRPLS